MKIKNYLKVSGLEEAYTLLQEDKNNIIIGGGAWLKLTNKEVETMIDLENLKLNQIIEIGDSIAIGAMTTLRDIELNESLNHVDGGILVKALKGIMGISIRNIATIGGSIMGKYSFSDVLTPLSVMDVELEFYKAGMMPLSEFMAMRSINDILLNVIIKNRKSEGYFYSMKKTSLDFAVINVAITKNELYDIAIGARPSLCMKPVKAIEYLNKQSKLNPEKIEIAVQLAIEETKFGTNSRASGEYREDIAAVYIKRGINEVTKL